MIAPTKIYSDTQGYLDRDRKKLHITFLIPIQLLLFFPITIHCSVNITQNIVSSRIVVMINNSIDNSNKIARYFYNKVTLWQFFFTQMHLYSRAYTHCRMPIETNTANVIFDLLVLNSSRLRCVMYQFHLLMGIDVGNVRGDSYRH